MNPAASQGDFMDPQPKLTSRRFGATAGVSHSLMVFILFPACKRGPVHLTQRPGEGGAAGELFYADGVKLRHRLSDIFRYDVRMEMTNCLFNTFNYICNMIISEVICSFCGHGDRNCPCCLSTFLFNFFQHCNILREHDYCCEKSTTVCCCLLTTVNYLIRSSAQGNAVQNRPLAACANWWTSKTQQTLQMQQKAKQKTWSQDCWTKF